MSNERLIDQIIDEAAVSYEERPFRVASYDRETYSGFSEDVRVAAGKYIEDEDVYGLLMRIIRETKYTPANLPDSTLRLIDLDTNNSWEGMLRAFHEEIVADILEGELVAKYPRLKALERRRQDSVIHRRMKLGLYR